MDYRKTAQQICDNIGGRKNIISAAHCATRLRLVIGDNAKCSKEAIEAIDGVRGSAGKTVKFKFLGTGMISVMPVPLLAAHPRECSPQGRTRYVPSACACRWTCPVHLHRPP